MYITSHTPIKTNTHTETYTYKYTILSVINDFALVSCETSCLVTLQSVQQSENKHLSVTTVDEIIQIVLWMFDKCYQIANTNITSITFFRINNP